MATTVIDQYLGPAGTPQEVRDLRKSSFDLHEQLGTPVVFKHRWNLDDLAAGRTWRCPYHDELYGNRDVTWDTTCFGTGFVGGYADGQIVFATIQDTQETAIRISPQGVLTMDMHPAMTAPWLPEMGDGDLLIVADFIPDSWTISDTFERYVLRDVTPVTMRGPGWGRQNGALVHRQRISQQSQIDRLPPGHQLYQVPIVFNYSHVPPDPTPPYVPEPGDVGYSEFEISARLRGIDPDVPTPVIEGTQTTFTLGARISGTAPDPGTYIDF